MMDILIEKITVDRDGILCVIPKINFSFDKIYRSAMGVHWNEEKHYLYHNPPKEWDALRWYK